MYTRIVRLSMILAIALASLAAPVFAASAASETVISGTTAALVITATGTSSDTMVNVDGTLMDIPWHQDGSTLTATINTVTDWPAGYLCFKIENGDLTPTVDPQSDFEAWTGDDGWICRKPSPTTSISGSVEQLVVTVTGSAADTSVNVDGTLFTMPWEGSGSMTATVDTREAWGADWLCFKVENGVVPSIDPSGDFVAYEADPTWVCRKPEPSTTVRGTLDALTVIVTGSASNTMVNVDGSLKEMSWEGTGTMTATVDTREAWGADWLCFKVENGVVPSIDPASDFEVYEPDPNWVCRKPPEPIMLFFPFITG